MFLLDENLNFWKITMFISKLYVVLWVITKMTEISLAHGIAENFNKTSLYAYEY